MRAAGGRLLLGGSHGLQVGRLRHGRRPFTGTGPRRLRSEKCGAAARSPDSAVPGCRDRRRVRPDDFGRPRRRFGTAGYQAVMNESPVERSAAGVRATGESPSASVTSVSDIGLKRALAVAEEAAFLWVSRSAVARSSAVTFDVLARMDQRLSRLVYKLSERPALAAPFLQHDPAAFESGL